MAKKIILIGLLVLLVALSACNKNTDAISGGTVADIPKIVDEPVIETETAPVATPEEPSVCGSLLRDVNTRLVCGDKVYLSIPQSTTTGCSISTTGLENDLTFEIINTPEPLTGEGALKAYLIENAGEDHSVFMNKVQDVYDLKWKEGYYGKSVLTEKVGDEDVITTTYFLAYLRNGKVTKIYANGKEGTGCISHQKFLAFARLMFDNEKKAASGILFS